MPAAGLTFKIASEPDEIEQVHRLNYRTFVEEIPQHPPNEEKRLVDRFHDENTYCICLDGGRLAGMLALRGNRPFSLDAKLPDLDRHLPPDSRPCEIRLLAVEPAYRNRFVFGRLLRFAVAECLRRGYTLALISGTPRQSRLYRHMGFVPFAGPVGTPAAPYQPMLLPLHAARPLLQRLRLEMPAAPGDAASFLPGPVQISPAVQAAFAAPPVSHRARAFLQMTADVQRRLRELTGARHVGLFLGSGTLGNDVVAAHLRIETGSGLVLANGEFGERLVDHARRMGLAFEVLRAEWGRVHDLARVAQWLDEHPRTAWLWSTHCETSCGVLNDLEGLSAICRQRGIKLCLDCTSSLGTVPVDLSSVFLASSVSGKGLAALPGISMVFYNHEPAPDSRVPRYLDLGYYRAKQGVPFTQSSNLMAALHQALRELDAPRRFAAVRRQHELLRDALVARGIPIMAGGAHASPAVISIPLPPTLSSMSLGRRLEEHGYLLSYRSEYLRARNIVQICLMGHIADDQCRALAAIIADLLAREAQPGGASSPRGKSRTHPAFH